MNKRTSIATYMPCLVLAVGVSGCASSDWPPGGALDSADRTAAETALVVTVHRKTSNGWQKEAVSPRDHSNVLGDLLLPAKLADAVYRREFGKDAIARIDFGCTYISKEIGWGIPPSAIPDGWIRVRSDHLTQWGVSLEPRYLCASRKGIAYELYARTGPDGKPSEVVLAFRGTENDGEQWLADWSSNLSQLDFGRNDNESFRDAREAAREITKHFQSVLHTVEPTPACKSLGPSVRQIPVTFVGHSLGGGLAQHAAYSVGACDALKAVTFNSSPVTGWFFLRNRPGELRNEDPLIVRAYNDREVLAYLRGLTTFFNFPRENRQDLQLAFRDFTSERHSMALLVYWLERALHAGRGPTASGELRSLASEGVREDLN